MKYIKLTTLATLLLLLTLCVTSCGVSTHASDFCLIYTPVYTHKADTELTKRQVDNNNVAYEAACVDTP